MVTPKAAVKGEERLEYCGRMAQLMVLYEPGVCVRRQRFWFWIRPYDVLQQFVQSDSHPQLTARS